MTNEQEQYKNLQGGQKMNRLDLSFHQEIAPKVLEAVRKTITTCKLNGNGRSLRSTLIVDAGFHASDAEYDVVTLISEISQAVGAALIDAASEEQENERTIQ